MTESSVKIYRCDFCKKKGFRRHLIERHEQFCAENPKNKVACFGCEHLATTDIQVENDYGGSRSVGTFECKCTNKLMYHIKAVEKRLLERYPETFEEQVPMPNECSDAKYWPVQEFDSLY